MSSPEQRVYEALEQAIIGLSSGLAQIPEGDESRAPIKKKLEEMFEKWRVLDAKLNPCNTRIND